MTTVLCTLFYDTDSLCVTPAEQIANYDALKRRCNRSAVGCKYLNDVASGSPVK